MHAKAKTAKVSTWREGEEARLRVEDDGVGFDTSKTERRSLGYALLSIRQRLGEFGGRLEVESKPGRGTRVTISVPLQQ
jgi:signal transduction histidine kinase